MNKILTITFFLLFLSGCTAKNGVLNPTETGKILKVNSIANDGRFYGQELTIQIENGNIIKTSAELEEEVFDYDDKVVLKINKDNKIEEITILK